MTRYLAKRALLVVPTAIAASILVFVLMRALPGDVVLTILGDTQHSVEMRETLREELGLNEPLPIQYARWLASMLTGGLGGRSLETGEPISAMVSRELPVTLLLTLYATTVSLLVSFPLGVAAGHREGRPLDLAIRIITLGGLALPVVWLALIVLIGLLRIFAWSPPIIYSGPLENLREHVALMLWPALLLAWEHGAHIAGTVRAVIAERLQAPSTVSARAKGLAERTVLWRHAGRHALVPAITMAAVQTGALLGGAIVVEVIFGLPGMGRSLVRAAIARDYPVVQSLAVLLVVLYLVLNLVADVLCVLADPRLRSGAEAR
jgi:peptide/nickel transport system permease protein